MAERATRRRPQRAEWLEIPIDVRDGLYPAIDEAVGRALDDATLGELEGLLGVTSPSPAIRNRLHNAVRNYLLQVTPADGAREVLMVRWARVRRYIVAIAKTSAAMARATRRLAELLDPMLRTDKRDRCERDRALAMIWNVGDNSRLGNDMLRLEENLREAVLPLLGRIEAAAQAAPARIPSGPRRGPGRRDALMVPLLAELIVLLERHRGAGSDTAYVDRGRTEGACGGALYEAASLIAARLPRVRGTIAGRAPHALVRAILRHRPAARRLARLLAARQTPSS